jgi:glutamate 5-kinase
LWYYVFMSNRVEQLDDVLVVKVGTTTMFRHDQGRELLDQDRLSGIGEQVLRFRELGYNVPIISSGAVTAGLEATGSPVRPTGSEAMPETQRLATIGWHRVLRMWEKALDEVNVGGMLVTRRELDLEAPEHDEVLRTTHTLLGHGDIPILNENDGITHAELSHQSFGQNDTLAAIYAAQIARSELFGERVSLVLLSDVDGVYADVSDPSSVISEISAGSIADYEHLAGGSNGVHGKGGMKTKFEAARIATSAGVEMWVANGQTENAIQLALDGEIGTHFTL